MSLRDNTVVATLTAGDESVTLDHQSEVYVEDCEFKSTPRTSIAARTVQHGSRHAGPAYRDGGIWDAQIRVRGEDLGLESNRSAVEAVLGELLDGAGTLEWVNQGGVTPIGLQGLLLVDESWRIDGSSWLVHVQVSSERPFAEDVEATTTDSAALSVGGGGFTIPLTIPFTFTASSGGDLEVTHAGDFKHAYPVLRAYGPITNPHVVNHTTGQRLVFSGSIAAGDFWEIDLFDRSVLLNGVTKVRALVASQSTWWACVRGVNELQLAGSGYTSSTFLRAYMKSSWG